MNKYNLYNQVGLIAINCMGDIGPGTDSKTGVSLREQATFEEQM